MCSGMKLLITPLLSGLLENDFNKMTEFDVFFKEIEKDQQKESNDCIILIVKFTVQWETLRENIFTNFMV